MSKVAIMRCETYDEVEVKRAISQGIDLIGGIEQFVKTDEKILLKPNLLAADAPERCSTTNPSVFKAVAELFIEAGGDVSYGDSPAFHTPSAAAKKAGILAIAEALKVPLADFVGGQDIFFEDGLMKRKLVIANGVIESDGIVSLPKMKTHGLARMTGCIKNQFGCMPGALKGEMHVKLPNPVDFSKMLVDLNYYVKPRLYIMDGIMAMEGNGPRGGTARAVNVLLISADPVALDASVCRMMDLDPEYVSTTFYGMEVGMGTYKSDDIELLGNPIEDFMMNDFDVVKRPLDDEWQIKGLVSKFSWKHNKLINKLLVAKPVINESECVKCGICVLMCPVNPKALSWTKQEDGDDKSKPPVYDYSRCIRCYCCQELCPESAISIKVPFLRKLTGTHGVQKS